ncbi:MAG: hypothetical protein ACJ742_09740 [Actinomycetes bacterium]
MRSRTGPIILAIALLAAAAACDSKPTSRQSSAPSSTQATGQHEQHGQHQGAAKATTPEGLAAELQQYFAVHTLLALRQTRSVVTGNAAYREAADHELEEYTGELGQIVAGAYGAAQGDRFEQVWQRMTGDVSSYADAVAGNDAAAKDKARAALLADADAYGSWLAEVSDGRATASDATAELRTHVQQVMDQTDAYAGHDYNRAYRTERDAYEHMFAAGTSLAAASAPKAAAALDAPVEKLRAAFGMLLGEHMQLIIDAQRATFAGAPEFKAAAAQVNENTAALTKGMGAIVGPKKAEEFQSAWAEHVEGLLDYSTAVASNDEAEKALVREKMRGYGARLALYLSDIVRNELPLEPITQALGEHDQHLVDQTNAYAAKRFDEAQEMEVEGYGQMLGVANTLVGAIQRTVKPQLPVGGSQTGGGGTATWRR